MEATRTNRQRLMEWVRRYLPNELAGWAGELGAATAYVNGVRWSYAAQAGRRRPMRVLLANAFVVGSIVADIAFYAMAIFSYERFKGLLAVRSQPIEEVDGEPVPAVAVA